MKIFSSLCNYPDPGATTFGILPMSKPGEALGIHICSSLGEYVSLRNVLRAAKTNFRALAAVFSRSVHVNTQPAALRDQC